jgi:hypothetical protein
MKLKFTSLILFASIISANQFCFAEKTKYAPAIQTAESIISGPVFERNEAINFTKPINGSKAIAIYREKNR